MPKRVSRFNKKRDSVTCPSPRRSAIIPAPPTPLSNYVDDRGVPTKEFVDYLNRLRDWQISVQAALSELEPP